MTIENKTVVLTVKGTTEGIDQSIASIQKEGIEIQKTQAVMDQRSASLEKQATKYNDLYRVEQQYTAGQASIQRAAEAYVQKGGDAAKASELQAAALVGLAQKHDAALARIVALGEAEGATASSMKLAADAASILGVEHQKTGIKANQMREAMVIVHEMLSGNYKRAVGSATIELQNFGLMQGIVAAAMSPLGAALIAAVAVTGVLTAANYAHHESIKAVATAYQLSGGAIGMSRSEMESFAQAMGAAGDISTKQARTIEAAVMTAAQVPAAAMKDIADIAQDYAKAFTGGDLAKAATDLAKAYKDPTQAAKSLDDQINFLTASQLHQIEVMQASGDKMAAFAIYSDALKGRLTDLADHGVGYLGQAVHGAANWWNEFWDAAGRVGKSDTLQQQLDAAQKKLDQLNQVKANVGTGHFGVQSYDPADIAAQQKVVNGLQQQVDLETKLAALRGQRQQDRETVKAGAALGQQLDPSAAFQTMLGQQAQLAKAISVLKSSPDLGAPQKHGDDLEQLRQMQSAYDGLGHAIDSYSTSGQKAQALANATTRSIGMGADAAKIYLAGEQKRVELMGSSLPLDEQARQIAAAKATAQAGLAVQMDTATTAAKAQAEAQARLAAAAGLGAAAIREATYENQRGALVEGDAAAAAALAITQKKAEADAVEGYTNETVRGLDNQTAANNSMAAAVVQGQQAVRAAAEAQYLHVAAMNISKDAMDQWTQAQLAAYAEIKRAYEDNQASGDNLSGVNTLKAQTDKIQLLQDELAIDQKLISLHGIDAQAAKEMIAREQAMLDIEAGRVKVAPEQRQAYIDQAGQIANLTQQAEDLKKADEERARNIRHVADDITRTASSDIYDKLTGKNVNVWQSFKDLGLRAIADIAAKMLETKFIMPTVIDVMGSSGDGSSSTSGAGLLSGGGSSSGLGSLISLGGSASSTSGMFGGPTISSTVTPYLSSAGTYLFGSAATPGLTAASGASVGDVVAGETLTSADFAAPASEGLIGSGGASAALSGVGAGVAGGALVGSLVGNATHSPGISAAAGAAGGALSAMAMGAMMGMELGPIGMIAGAIIGGIVGAISGQHISVGPNMSAVTGYMPDGSGIGVLKTGADNGGNAAGAGQLLQYSIDALKSTTAAIGGSLANYQPTEMGFYKGKYFVADKQSGADYQTNTFTDQSAATADYILRQLKDGLANNDLTASSNVKTALGHIAYGTDATTMATDLAFAAQFDASVAAMKAGVTDYAQAAEAAAITTSTQLVASIEDFRKKAADLGLSTKDAADATKSAVETFLGLKSGQAISALEASVETLYGKLEGISGLLSEVGIDQKTAADAVSSQVKQLLGITTTPAVSAYDQQIQGLNQTFTNLAPILDKLGISSKDAAAALKKAVDEVNQARQEAWSAAINTAGGTDFLTQIQSVFDTGATNITNYGTQKGAELTNAQFTQILGGLNPDQLLTAVQTYGNAANVGSDAAKAFLSLADSVLKSKYAAEQNSETLQKATSDLQFFTNAAASLASFNTSLLTGSASPLSPKNQYSVANDQLQQDVGLAKGGDQTALGRIQADEQAFLAASKAFNASNSQYAADVQSVVATNDNLIGYASAQASSAQQIVAVLNGSVLDQLKMIDVSINGLDLKAGGAGFGSVTNGTVGTINAAGLTPLQQQTAANVANVSDLYKTTLHRAPDATGLAGWTSALASGVSLGTVASDIATSPEATVDKLYQQLLGRAPDATGLAGYGGALATGTMTADQIAANIKASAEYQTTHSAAGGWGEVPYDGARTDLHKKEMVLPEIFATPLRSMLLGKGAGNDNTVLIGTLTQALSRLESKFDHLTQIVAQGSRAQVAATHKMGEPLANMSMAVARQGAMPAAQRRR